MRRCKISVTARSTRPRPSRWRWAVTPGRIWVVAHKTVAVAAGLDAAYCMAVCPAGEDVLGPYLEDPRAFMDTVL